LGLSLASGPPMAHWSSCVCYMVRKVHAASQARRRGHEGGRPRIRGQWVLNPGSRLSNMLLALTFPASRRDCGLRQVLLTCVPTRCCWHCPRGSRAHLRARVGRLNQKLPSPLWGVCWRLVCVGASTFDMACSMRSTLRSTDDSMAICVSLRTRAWLRVAANRASSE